MANKPETLIELLRAKTASMNQSEISKFSAELKIRLPDVINKAAEAAKNTK